jgi:hypothetical protein
MSIGQGAQWTGRAHPVCCFTLGSAMVS